MKNMNGIDVPDLVQVDCLVKQLKANYDDARNLFPAEVGSFLKSLSQGINRDRHSDIIGVCWLLPGLYVKPLLRKDYMRLMRLKCYVEGIIPDEDSSFYDAKAFYVSFTNARTGQDYLRIYRTTSGMVYYIECPSSKLYYLGGLLMRHEKRILDNLLYIPYADHDKN